MSLAVIYFIRAVIFLVIFVLPVYLVVLSWKKSEYLKYPISIILVWYFFSWWRAFYPEDGYFISMFERISGIPLPASAKIIDKQASFPNFLGDFDSCFVVELPKADLNSLVSKTSLEPALRELDCNSGDVYHLVTKGKNQNEYPFMSWYVTEDGQIWGYYTQY